jgi:hypothetical protein
VRRRPHLASRLAVISTVATASLIAASANGLADVAPTGPASVAAAKGTPSLAWAGKQETVRQLVQCGSTMFAVGQFTSIAQNGTTYTRNNAFSFSAVAPYTMTDWDPNVNGIVNTVAFDGNDCTHAYIGGKFTSVGGTAVKNLAEVDTTTGAVIPSFVHSAAGQVDNMVGWNGHILTGGSFTSINGSSTSPYFASLNPATGRNDGFLNLGVSGNYVYTDQAGNHSVSNPTRVYNQEISHDGTKDLIEGVFTSIGGQARRQVAVIDLTGYTATVDGWHAPMLDENCASVEPFYAKAASWSGDDQTIFVATTGYKPASGPGYSTHDPRAGLCDAAAAFPSTATDVSPTWINYTGCDSLFATVADGSTAYFGGHERYANNPNGCDGAGPGAVAAPGMVGLSPSSGAVTWNPTRSRGHGADDMVVTSAGLWIASDNGVNGEATACAKYPNHAGICFLPYTS